MLKTHGDTIGGVEERLIRMRDVRALTGLGASTVYRLISQDRFPRPVHPLGNKVSAWKLSQVSAWVADRAAGKAA